MYSLLDHYNLLGLFIRLKALQLYIIEYCAA